MKGNIDLIKIFNTNISNYLPELIPEGKKVLLQWLIALDNNESFRKIDFGGTRSQIQP